MQCAGFGDACAVPGCFPAAALPAAADRAARTGPEWKSACMASPLNYFFPMPSKTLWLELRRHVRVYLL